jgi:hypothetical protein
MATEPKLKNAPKGGAFNGTSLEAFIMCNHSAHRYLKNEKKTTKLGVLQRIGV